MYEMTGLPQRYALILDHDAIEAVLRKAAASNLPRRECRPLDHRSGKRVSKEVARYDEEIEAAPVEEICAEEVPSDLHAANDSLIEDPDLDEEEDDFY